MFTPDFSDSNPFIRKNSVDQKPSAPDKSENKFIIKRRERDAIRAAIAEALRPVLEEYDVNVYASVIKDEESEKEGNFIEFEC
jgi:hypothetical protein